MKRGVVLLFGFLLCSAAYADKVHLNSGEIFEGQIIEENNEYVSLSSGGAPMYLSREQIKQIEKSGSPAPEDHAVEDVSGSQEELDKGQLPMVFNESELDPEQQKNFKENYVVQKVLKVDLDSNQGVQERDLSIDELGYNASVLMQNGRIQEAVRSLEQALVKDPNHKQALRMLADIYNEHGAPEKSIDIYSKLISFDPEDHDLYNSRGYAFGRLGSPEKALEEYNKALSIKPEDANALSNRAAVYLRGGQIELAKKDYERLAPLDPEQGNFGLGNVAASNEDWPGALTYYDKVAEVSPDFPPVYMMRAQVFLQMDNEEKALQNLKHAKKLGVNLPPDLQEMVDGK